MDAAERPGGLAASICPKCGLGELVKHCDPENRCGWWSCEFDCGYALSLPTGVAIRSMASLSPRHGTLESRQHGDEDEDAGEHKG